jgi:hypothetical protein
MDDGPVTTPPAWQRVGTVFRAKFDGACPACNDGPLVAGVSRVQRWDRTDGTRTVYTHDDCTP